MPNKSRITQSYAAVCETLSDRAYTASQRRGAQQSRERELDEQADIALGQAVREDPLRWERARATDLDGERVRQRAALAEDDRTIDSP